jgi:hypothetical protein
VPDEIDLFDRGISHGDTPRLWIDVVAHVLMGRDKRMYRFVEDTRYGRIVLAESHEAAAIADAVTGYVARRMIERERALAEPLLREQADTNKPRRSGGVWTFAFGFIAGGVVLFGLALFAALRTP